MSTTSGQDPFTCCGDCDPCKAGQECTTHTAAKKLHTKTGLALNTTISALTLFKEAASGTGVAVPGLRQAAGCSLWIVETIAMMNDNKTLFNDLAQRCMHLTLIIIHNMRRQEQRLREEATENGNEDPDSVAIPEELQHKVQAFCAALKKTEKTLREILGRRFIWRFILARADKIAIARHQGKISDAVTDFHMLMTMDIYTMVGRKRMIRIDDHKARKQADRYAEEDREARIRACAEAEAAAEAAEAAAEAEAEKERARRPPPIPVPSQDRRRSWVDQVVNTSIGNGNNNDIRNCGNVNSTYTVDSFNDSRVRNDRVHVDRSSYGDKARVTKKSYDYSGSNFGHNKSRHNSNIFAPNGNVNDDHSNRSHSNNYPERSPREQNRRSSAIRYDDPPRGFFSHDSRRSYRRRSSDDIPERIDEELLYPRHARRGDDSDSDSTGSEDEDGHEDPRRHRGSHNRPSASPSTRPRSGRHSVLEKTHESEREYSDTRSTAQRSARRDARGTYDDDHESAEVYASSRQLQVRQQNGCTSATSQGRSAGDSSRSVTSQRQKPKRRVVSSNDIYESPEETDFDEEIRSQYSERPRHSQTWAQPAEVGYGRRGSREYR
ncbi:hypothetical protein CC2G_000063 [Coprinopsis cinerea AmutBmut pab1-1]|nr:hypothetical protein CC2G_000063 [Coprinopsis cinerea AmutBmut pab1-1]